MEEKEHAADEDDDDKYSKQPLQHPEHSAVQILAPRSAFNRSGPLAAPTVGLRSSRSLVRPSCVVVVMFVAATVMLGAWLCFFLQMPLNELHPRQLFRSHFQSTLLSARLSNSQPRPIHARPGTSLTPPLPTTSALPVYTAHNLTFFTVYQREADLFQLFRSADSEKLVPVDHEPFVHHLYALSRLVPHAHHLIVYVRSIDDCTVLEALPVDHVCRVTSCFSIAQTGSAVDGAVRLRCLLTDVRDKSSTPLLAFVDDHTLLFPDFLSALFRVATQLPSFVLAGSSVSVGLRREGIGARAWHDDLTNSLTELAAVPTAAADRQQPHYFAFPRSQQLPLQSLNASVVVGRSGQVEHNWERHLLAHLLLDDRTPVVDGSRAITAADMRHADQSNRTAELNDWNNSHEGSLFNLTTAVGVFSNSHYILTGRCPTCSLKENPDTDFALLLHRQATVERQVILLAVNSEYLSLAFNWLCRARAQSMHNYVLLAEDRFSFRVLRHLSLPAILSPDAPYKQPSPPTSPVAHHRRLYLRALYMHRAAELGYHAVSLSLDTLLFTSPFPHLAPAIHCDAHVYYHDRRVSTTLLSVLPTAAGRRFLHELLSCEADNYNFTAAHGQNRFYYSDEADNNCGHFVMKRLVKRSGLKRCELNGAQWIERAELMVQSAQRAGQWPIMVHSDGGVADIEAWVRGWSGWKVNDRAMMDAVLSGERVMRLQCQLVAPPVFDAPRFDDRQSFRLSIHILVSSAPSALSTTLDSLAAAVYDQSIPIDIHITVQQPLHQTVSNTQRLVEASRVAEAFEWPRGEKTVRWHEKHVGETIAWMKGWQRSEVRDDSAVDDVDEAFYLGLRGGQAVSVQWFVWLKVALESYYFNPFQFDAQLMGIHLLHQFAIVGETPAARYGSRIPSSVLNGTLLYHYQYVPLMGTVFFPNHLSAFYRWHASQPANNRTACLPTLVSNQWLQSDPDDHWQLHLTRFAFDQGWYALHTNFASQPDKRPRAVVVDRQEGSVREVETIDRLHGAGEEVMLPIDVLPLYDVHFQRVDDNRTLLHLRKDVFPPETAFVSGGSAGNQYGKQSGNITRLLVDALRVHVSSVTDDLFALLPAKSTIDPEVLLLSTELSSQLSLPPPALPTETRYDRCFVLDDDDNTSSLPVSSTAPIDITASLPFPYNQSLTVPELYAHIYETAMATLPKQPSATRQPLTTLFIIYRPRLLLPFDRHLRGLYFAFLTALLTGRVLLVDWPDLESMYDCPFTDSKWNYGAFAPYLHSANATQYEDMEHGRLVDELRMRSLSAMYSRPVLVYGEAVSHDRLLFTNVAYKPYAMSLFGTASRMRRTGLLMRLLLSKPKGALVQQAKAVQQRMKLGAARYSVCVHLVAGDRRRATGADSALPLTSEHWSCMLSQLHHLGFSRSDVRLVVSSDSTDEHSVELADARLNQYGSVVANPDVFTNGSQYGVGNATVRASQQRDPLTGALSYDPYFLSLYQLGECDVSLSSGSTFGIFGSARSGFSKRAYIYKPAPPPVKGADGKAVAAGTDEKDYCGPMHRIDMPKDNDINF